METYNKDNAVIREAIRKSNKTKQDKIDKITSNYHRLSNELRGKISKPISEFENELFELRIKNLKDTLSKLTSKNKYDYLVGLKRSALEELTFIYDHTEIDRNVYREEVKKQIATRRHKTVIAETKVADAEKKYQDYQTLMDFENRYALEIDNAKNKTFEDYQAINPTYKPLKDLYAEIDENFEKYAQEEKEFINNLINTHLDFIKEHYNNHLLIIPKIQNYDAGIELLNKKKEIAELEIQKANVEAEIYVYEVSISEKIEVSNKLKLVQEELSQINEKLEKLYVEANDLNNVYQNSLQYLHDLKKNSIKELKNKKANEQSDLNQKIKEAILKETDLLENLLNVFATEVKKNFISYEEFKNKALLENSKKEIEYRKEKLAAANTEEEKEAYSLPIDKYLAKLTANYAIDNENKIQEAKKNYQENVKKINEDYKNDLLKIKEDRKNRKEIYLDKKAETKLKIKNADSSEVSELKEILKIYKKDIKAGDWKRRHKVKKDYKAKLAKAKFDYEILINELTKQKSYVLEVKKSAERKEIEKTINKDNRYLNRSLRKERHLTRYRKNMNKAKRDAILGYAFLAIWGIGFIIFTLIPIFYSLVISLSNVISDVNGYTEVFYENGKLFPAFTGLENYYSIFLKDVDFFYTQLPTFLRSLILFSPIVLFISFVIAILLNTKIVGRTFFRIIYFLPVIIVSGPLLTLLNESPNSSGGTALTLSLDGTFIYDILLVAGEKVTEYADFVFKNFIVILWMTGVPIVLFINGLQKIDKSLYEAAEIDGANKWQSFWTVTYPLIKQVALISSLFIILQIATIDISGVNPIRTAISTGMSSSSAQFGILSAMGWIQAIFVILAVTIAFLIFKEKVYHDKQKSYEEVEALKEKKAIRKEKLNRIFHIDQIKSFFKKLFTPVKRIKKSKVEGGN